MENNDIVAYDLANELINSEPVGSKKYILAQEFLAYQDEFEQLNGDDDNPFNPNVAEYMRKEEEFINAIQSIKENKLILTINEFKNSLNENANGLATSNTFSLDGDKVFKGWTTGEHWNGWECPFFEKEEADKIAARYNGHFKNNVYTFEDNGDENTTWFEEPESYGACFLETTEGKKEVWAIGSYNWVWQLDDYNEL